jgi:hypothetical protein
MRNVALRPRTALPRSASTTPRLPLHPRISTRNGSRSRKHPKPSKTNDGMHFDSVHMNTSVASAKAVIPSEGPVLARRGICPSFTVPQTFHVRTVPDDVPQAFPAARANFPSSPTLPISNRHFLARLETLEIRDEQRGGVNSNRHFWEGWPAIVQCLAGAAAENLLPSACCQISNRQRLARLETISNLLKIKAGDDF